MDATTVGIIGIAVMVLIFFSRMPVAYVMTLIGFLGFSIMISFKGGLNLLSRNIYEVFSSYGLTTIPLFIFMGQLAFNSGISRRLYDTGYKFLGSTRGGLAMATVSACTAFGAVCGSSPATAATMATVGLPEMKRYKYADELATGCVASGGAGNDHAAQRGSDCLRCSDRGIYRKAVCSRNSSGHFGHHSIHHLYLYTMSHCS
jgi:TRAP-type mannitol/chloroaromatic compound transport system permease large subunit